jgi:hypothetical protein
MRSPTTWSAPGASRRPEPPPPRRPDAARGVPPCRRPATTSRATARRPSRAHQRRPPACPRRRTRAFASAGQPIHLQALSSAPCSRAWSGSGCTPVGWPGRGWRNSHDSPQRQSGSPFSSTGYRARGVSGAERVAVRVGDDDELWEGCDGGGVGNVDLPPSAPCRAVARRTTRPAARRPLPADRPLPGLRRPHLLALADRGSPPSRRRLALPRLRASPARLRPCRRLLSAEARPCGNISNIVKLVD